MGWDRKQRGNSNGYYYRSIRTPMGVKKQYLGRSTAAHEMANAIECKRNTHKVVSQMLHDEGSDLAEAEQLTDELFAWTELLSSAWFALTGHHYHAGEWRKRRGQQPKKPNS